MDSTPLRLSKFTPNALNGECIKAALLVNCKSIGTGLTLTHSLALKECVILAPSCGLGLGMSQYFCGGRVLTCCTTGPSEDLWTGDAVDSDGALWYEVDWVGFYIGSRQDTFDAEVLATTRAVHVMASRQQTGRDFTIFTDSQAAMSKTERLPRTRAGHGRRNHRPSSEGTRVGNTLTVRWVPVASGLGNEVADTCKGGREETQIRRAKG